MRYEKPINYAKLGWKYLRHLSRYRAYVSKHGYTCQACGGFGDYLAEYIDTWPRFEACGWCEGTGRVTRWGRGAYLRYMKELKRNDPTAIAGRTGG